MAVYLTLTVGPATREQFEALDDRVGQAMVKAGGPPPPGLMSHVVYPVADGFVVSDVWRTEDECRSFIDHTFRPLAVEAGLTVRELRVLPVWSFARP